MMRMENSKKENIVSVRYSNLSANFLMKIGVDPPCIHGILTSEDCFQCEQLSVKWGDKPNA